MESKRRKLLRKFRDKQRREANPEHEKQRCKDYYKKNRVEILERMHNYYLTHKEEKKNYNKKYHSKATEEI